MNNVEGFTFYKNYFEFYKNLSDKEKVKLMDNILYYMFEDKEPVNTNGLVGAITTNIMMPLTTSKNNIENGKKGGRPKKSEIKTESITETITESKSEIKPKAKANNISIFLFLISNFLYLKNKDNLKNKIEEWLKYKWERKEYYKETGFKTLLKQIEKNVEQYGEEKVVNLIDECMANNYKGIIFDKLQERSKERNNQTYKNQFEKNREMIAKLKNDTGRSN